MSFFINIKLMADNLPNVSEHKLSNGLTVWLSEEHSQPKVSGAMVIKAGAKDSPNTGIAHYFEHMMFKGTENIGTKDYKAEKPYMDKIIALYDKLALTSDAEQISSIQKEINKLNIEQSKYIIPNEFDQIISRFGGSGLNAYTSYDNTVYFNTFIPDYIEQWAEINSERFLHPVFRLFQNELETVYEEKNMYSDNISFAAIEKVLERVYKGTPYQYSILGSTENLKKPQLSEMIRFFETYYVGNNMGLMLCGDFDSKAILPYLEKTFGRIPAGNPKKKIITSPTKAKGREEMKVKIPIPMVKGFARIYKGAEITSTDNLKINIICALLNNGNGTGFLDNLIVENKLLMAMAANVTQANDCGVIAIGGVPKMIFQTRSGAEKLIMNQVDRIKKGDFPDSLFEAVKYEKKREVFSRLENTDKRTEMMIENFSQGNSWEDFISKIAALKALTKEDIMECANRYLGDDYLYASKKFGKYPKDNLEKPDLEPIPQKEGKTGNSAYYDSLDVNDNVVIEIKTPDFDNDCEVVPLSGGSELYYKYSDANQIFKFRVIYEIGKESDPINGIIDQYLSCLGTNTKSFNEFKSELQTIGSSLTFSVDENFFNVTAEGFDENFDKTLKLVNEFFNGAKGDKKILKQIKSSLKVEEKAFAKSSNDLAAALAEKIKFGDNSSYINRVKSKDIGKLKENTLIDRFNEIRKYEKSFHYSGSLSSESVQKTLVDNLDTKKGEKESEAFPAKKFSVYNEPVIYFFDDPDTRQSIISAYVMTDKPVTRDERSSLQLLNFYFGGDMTSVLFQQIREFRSLAYGVHSKLALAAPKHEATNGVIEAKLSTQSDKTIEALNLLDSLLKKIPMNESSFEKARRALGNYANNLYPDVRSYTKSMRYDLAAGFGGSKLNQLKAATMIPYEDFRKTYEEMFSEATPVYVIVGNKKSIDIDALKKMFKVEFVKLDSFYKK